MLPPHVGLLTGEAMARGVEALLSFPWGLQGRVGQVSRWAQGMHAPLTSADLTPWGTHAPGQGGSP